MRQFRLALLGSGLLTFSSLSHAARLGMMVPGRAAGAFTRSGRRFLVSRRSPGRAFACAAALLAITFVGVFAVRLPEPLGPDQALFACFTRFLAEGALPYRDIFDSKPPLLFYWYGLAALVPDSLPRAIWWLEGAWLALTLIATFAVASKLWDRSAGLAAAALMFVGMWSPGFGGFWSRAQAEELLALPMLASAWFALQSLERERRAVLAGVLLGLCGLMKIPALGISGAWLISFFVHVPWRGAVRRGVWLLLGIALPWASTVGLFAAAGELRSLWTATWVYPVVYATLMARPFGDMLLELVTQALNGSVLMLAAAALGFVFLVRRRARESTWLGSWAACAAAVVLVQRQMAGYHLLLLVPPLALAGGYGLSVARRAASEIRGFRVGLAAGMLALALLSFSTVSAWWTAYAPGARVLAGTLSRPAYLREIQQGAYSLVSEEEAARVIRERSRPEDTVLVWAWSPGIYSLSDRAPATRYVFHKVLLTGAPISRALPGIRERRAELIRKMDTAPPAFVVVSHGDSSFFDPMDSRESLAQFPELAAHLARGYVLERRVGRLTLYRRIGAISRAS